MIQELVELSAQGASPERASAYLRGVAALLDRSARPPVN
jgi:2-keto-4-pentenoate hydratase/2-oxohepta-3-ene-1,7-dioic acid hydratase in catechol pathway